MKVLAEISGMRTVHCVRAVFQAMGGVPGVMRADVSLGRVELDATSEASSESVHAALEPLGYRLESWRVQSRALSTLPGEGRVDDSAT